MIALMFLGMGQIIGSYLSGYVSDHYGARKGIYLNLFLLVSAITFSAYFLVNENFIMLIYFASILWGL